MTAHPGAGPSLPHLDPWMKVVLRALFVLYVAELFSAAAGVPTALAAWAPGAIPGAPWQVLTRFFVQGAGIVTGGNVSGVLLGLLVLYFFLPALAGGLDRRQALEALGAVALGGTLLPALGDLLGGTGVVFGWDLFLTAMVCLFGLMHPGATVSLYFVLPVPAVWFVWGSLCFAMLSLLAALGGSGGTLPALEHLGAWAGIYGWWHLRGPGARRRTLQTAGKRVERHLRVVEGARSRDDDVWH